MLTIATTYKNGMTSVHEMPFLTFDEVVKVAQAQSASGSVVRVEVEDEARLLVLDKTEIICYDK